MNRVKFKYSLAFGLPFLLFAITFFFSGYYHTSTPSSAHPISLLLLTFYSLVFGVIGLAIGYGVGSFFSEDEKALFQKTKIIFLTSFAVSVLGVVALWYTGKNVSTSVEKRNQIGIVVNKGLVYEKDLDLVEIHKTKVKEVQNSVNGFDKKWGVIFWAGKSCEVSINGKKNILRVRQKNGLDLIKFQEKNHPYFYHAFFFILKRSSDKKEFFVADILLRPTSGRNMLLVFNEKGECVFQELTGRQPRIVDTSSIVIEENKARFFNTFLNKEYGMF